MLRRTSLCAAGAISLVASANAADLSSPAGGYKDAPDVPVTATAVTGGAQAVLLFTQRLLPI